MSNTSGTNATTANAGRKQFERKKELEEARKLGRVPAEVDEEGRDINPHIPQYISQAPWYLSRGAPSLKHQKLVGSDAFQKSSLNKWYKKGKDQIVYQSTKYRKGACKNCGSMDHKTKDCLDRKRRRGAFLTGENIEADRATENLNDLSFEAKRDRWNGYNPTIYKEEVLAKYNTIDEYRKNLREEELRKQLMSSEETLAPKTSVDEFQPKTGSTAKTLRNREDRPKYLYNLDPSSAHFDPKTRSMRENPNPHIPADQLDYAGDNAYRLSGEYTEWLQSQRFAWDRSEKGEAVNPAAVPSQVEMLHKQLQERKKRQQEEHQKALLEKYGGEKYIKRPEELQTAQETEHYVQYSGTGQVISRPKKLIQKSRYEEDVFRNGHSAVWGSYYEDGKWGYACCQSVEKDSICPHASGHELMDGHVLSSRKRKRRSEDEDGHIFKRVKEEEQD